MFQWHFFPFHKKKKKKNNEKFSNFRLQHKFFYQYDRNYDILAYQHPKLKRLNIFYLVPFASFRFERINFICDPWMAFNFQLFPSQIIRDASDQTLFKINTETNTKTMREWATHTKKNAPTKRLKTNETLNLFWCFLFIFWFIQTDEYSVSFSTMSEFEKSPCILTAKAFYSLCHGSNHFIVKLGSQSNWKREWKLLKKKKN